MIAVSGRARVRAAVEVRPDVLAAAVLSLAFVAVAALTWHTWGELSSDTGYDVVAGARVAHGQLPYVDFIYYYGPLAPLLAGLVEWIGGAAIAPVVAFGFIVTAAILVATYRLARRFASPLGAALATAVTGAVAFAPNNYSYILPHTLSATLGTLLVLLFLLALLRATRLATTGSYVTVGVIGGLTALTKPEPTIAVAVAGVVWWATLPPGVRRRAFAAAAAPFIALPALVYGVFSDASTPHALVFENLYPRDSFREGGDALLRARMPFTPAGAAHLAEKFVLYAVGVTVLVFLARAAARRGLGRGSAVAVMTAVVLVAIVITVVRPETLRYYLEYAWGWLPAGAVLGALVLTRRVRRAGDPATRVRRAGELVACSALAVLAFTTFGGFFVLAPKPQMAVYYVPLAAIFLARLHLKELAPTKAAAVAGAAWLVFLAATAAGLTLHDARAETILVRGPGGALAARPHEAAIYTEALTWVHRAPGRTMLAGPLLTGLYALADRQSPLMQLSLLPGALPTRSAEDEAIVRIRRARVPVVLLDERPLPAYEQGPIGSGYDKALVTWIRGHYHHVATLGDGVAGGEDIDVYLLGRGKG